MVDRRVALLRGINVGKAKRIAMADLRALFDELGYSQVRTLLNSGNVAFTVTEKRAGEVGPRIEKAIAERLGVETRVSVLKASQLASAVRKNPLGQIAGNPSRLLLMALPDAKAVAKLKPLLAEDWAPEALALGPRMAYLWCAKGVLDGQLWKAVGRVLGEVGTARNLATMTKLLALAEET